MDPFTERILERARERQKKLLEYSGSEESVTPEVTPLRESNSVKSASVPTISSCQSKQLEFQELQAKDVVSDSNLYTKTSKDNTPLKGTVSEGNLPKFVRQNSKTSISSDMPGSPQLQLKTLNIQKENFNMEIKLSSSENVRLEVEFQEEDDSDGGGKENVGTLQQDSDDAADGQPTIREDAKKRLQRLGKLYAGGEDANISSPIHQTEARFLVEDNSTKGLQKSRINNVECESDKNASKGRKGLGGLAALAKDIDGWEDNPSTAKKATFDTKPQKKSWKPPAPRPPISSTRQIDSPQQSLTPRSTKSKAPKPPIDICVKTTVGAEIIQEDTPKSKDSTREALTQMNFDQNLLETLESQGFTRTTSNSRLIYSYDSQNPPNEIKKAEITTPTKLNRSTKDCIVEESELELTEAQASKTNQAKILKSNESKAVLRSPAKTNIKGSAIANRAAMFEVVSSPSKNNKDPALLSVSERKALFEKNKGAIPVPKAPISMATPLNVEKVVPKSQNGVSKSVSASKLASPVKAEKPTSSPVSVRNTTAKYPAPRPPIRVDDNVDSAFRIPKGEPGGIASKMAALFQNKSTISQQQIQSSVREQRQKEMDVLLNRFQRNKVDKNEQGHCADLESESDDEEVTEITAMISQKPAQIIKRFEGIPRPPPPPGPSGNKRRSGAKRLSKGDSPKVTAVLDDVKRIKVSPSNKPGRLYPCLSDIETATETETEHNTASPTPNNSRNSSFEDNYSGSDADAAETSFGRDILVAVCKNQTPQKRPIYDDSTESDVSDILDEMDDYLDEALAYDPENGPTPPKRRSTSPVNHVAQPSSSFQYKNFSPHKASPYKHSSPAKDFKTPSKTDSPRKSDELPAYVVDGDDVLPLTHTVSFYRRQQTQGSKTPVRQIVRHPILEETSESYVSTSSSSATEKSEIQSKIKELLEEMTLQQTIISQTSQALNLCYSTLEFTGSTEQVEAEKVLLLATHRRAAAQREIERLTVLKTLHSENKHPENVPLEKGTLTITNMVLPLKRDYVRALNATEGKGHHVVCLIKCAEQVLATKLVSTIATKDRNPNLELNIPGTICLNNISSNFTVQFEVYCLQAQKEILPHEVKYHINKKNNKITPKKGKPESRLVRPPKESPGGPQVVRSPTFALMGYVVFSMQTIKRKNWSLNNTPSMSPLEGIVEMRVKCELAMSVEYHGFLTMFEDVSGFGAWHRRWCMLKGHVLSYWKYPEEEKKKAPIDSVDLLNCITQEVGLVRRDICARLHTILIETKRPAQPQDRDSLVMECKGETTIIRHLLSADTKEERVEWCTMFNKALATIRMCGNSK